MGVGIPLRNCKLFFPAKNQTPPPQKKIARLVFPKKRQKQDTQVLGPKTAQKAPLEPRMGKAARQGASRPPWRFLKGLSHQSRPSTVPTSEDSLPARLRRTDERE